MKENDDIISVHKVYDSMEADLIKMQLELEGIDSYLKSDNAGGALPYLTMTTGIEIMVRREDALRANKVIKEKNRPD
ncbi:MAG: hypothetical protein KR126chlam3_01517 [Chlamydiae bacterium]|nr:hypothetical protein [Chlamydiota bacterium]